MSQSQSKKRKRPASFYKKCAKQGKFSKDKCLDKDMCGFLITCDRNREKSTVNEAYSLLNKYANQLYGEEEYEKQRGNNSNSEDEDVEMALKNEIKAIKETKSNERRFQCKETGAKQVIFIKTMLNNPNEIMYTILEDILVSQKPQSRNILRMLPVVGTCKADAYENDVKEMLKSFLQEESKISYCFIPKIRNNDKVTRNDLITSFGSIVHDISSNVTVNYDNPDLMILINVIKNIMCISVIKDFQKYKKFNLQELVSFTKAVDNEKMNIHKDIQNANDKKQDDDFESANRMISSDENPATLGNEPLNEKNKDENLSTVSGLDVAIKDSHVQEVVLDKSIELAKTECSTHTHAEDNEEDTSETKLNM